MAGDLALQAERIVLGSMLLDPTVIDPVAARLRSTDFADLRHASIYAAIVANHAGELDTGPVAVAITLNTVKELQRVGGAAYLHALIEAVPTSTQALYYVGVVRDAAAARRAIADATRLHQIAEAGDVGQIAAEQARLVDAWTARRDPDTPDVGIELDEFLAADEPEHDWILPGLIERGDRMILTGPEGGGKSTLFRQIGVQAAAGIHPFTGDTIDALCVLMVDLENSTRQVRRELRPLRLAAGRYESKPGLHIRVRPEGLDLLSDDDGRWLLALAAAVRPDLILIGPTYKMAAGDPTEEMTARAVTIWLDRLRAEQGAALLIEAHSPHGSAGKRPIRPYGASLWLRWPEFGLHLSDEGRLIPWRGARDERDWPTILKRGGEWPWTPETNPAEVLWAKILQACSVAGERPSIRQLEKITGAGHGTIQRAIDRRRREWESLTFNQADLDFPQVEGGVPDVR